MNPLVSVVMSTYNSDKSLKKSINSILQQTYEPIELLICDDGSQDSTSKILEQYADSDSRIKLIKNNKNIGLTKSLNKLISISSGQFIARQDSDDYSDLNRLSIQVKFLINSKYDAVVSRGQIQNSKKTIPRFSYFLPYKLVIKYKNPFLHGTLLIKSEILKNINYDERFIFAQDYKLYFDLLDKGIKFKKIFNTLYYLNNKNNISSKNKLDQEYYANCAKKNLVPTKNKIN